MNTEIKFSDLTPEQKKQLLAEAKQEELSAKNQRQANLKALEEIAQETVPQALETLKEASERLKQAKEEVYKLFTDYLKLKIDTFKTASDQKTHTISTPQGKVTLGYKVTDGYTDNANYGVALVHKFLGTLAKDDDSASLLKTVYRLLQKNTNGDLDSKKVLLLTKIANEDYPNTEFQEGVELIQSAYSPKMSKWFIQAYETIENGVEKSIPLSITSIDFSADFDLSFLIPKTDE